MRNWYWAEQESVDHAENSCIGANTDGKREHSHQSERGVLHQDARSVANILPESLQPRSSLHVADFVLYLATATHFQACRATSALFIHSAFHVVLHQDVEIRSDFSIQVALHLAATEDVAQ